MKKTMIPLLCAAQLGAATQPAAAAELYSDRSGSRTEAGAFAGARVRVPLGSEREQPHAGLALTPVRRSDKDGTLRFARGAELGFSRGEAVSLKLGGRPVTNLVQGENGPKDGKLGVSTAGWVAIGVGTVAVLLAAIYLACTPTSECVGDDE